MNILDLGMLVMLTLCWYEVRAVRIRMDVVGRMLVGPVVVTQVREGEE